jgi:uncharacterized membrane protein
MTQDDINQGEWSNPENWATLTYRSRKDSRMIVPKRRGFGVTVNFGNKNGVILFVALLALPLVVFLALYFSGVHFGRH